MKLLDVIVMSAMFTVMVKSTIHLAKNPSSTLTTLVLAGGTFAFISGLLSLLIDLHILAPVR